MTLPMSVSDIAAVLFATLLVLALHSIWRARWRCHWCDRGNWPWREGCCWCAFARKDGPGRRSLT